MLLHGVWVLRNHSLPMTSRHAPSWGASFKESQSTYDLQTCSFMGCEFQGITVYLWPPDMLLHGVWVLRNHSLPMTSRHAPSWVVSFKESQSTYDLQTCSFMGCEFGWIIEFGITWINLGLARVPVIRLAPVPVIRLAPVPVIRLAPVPVIRLAPVPVIQCYNNLAELCRWYMGNKAVSHTNRFEMWFA